VSVLTMSTSLRDSESFARLLDGLDDSPGSRSVRSSTLSLWVRRDPEAALEWLKTNPLPAADFQLIVRPLVEAFSARDADAALRMADTLPEGMRAQWRAEVDARRAQ